MKRINGTVIGVCVVILAGLCTAGIITSPTVFKSFIDFDKGYVWRIEGTKVDATAAQLNQLSTGIFSMSGLTFDDGSTITLGASTLALTNTLTVTIDGTTAVTTNQTFLSSTGVTNTFVIVDGLIKQVN